MPEAEIPLAQFANRASNILFGYGEATEGSMLRRMEQLVEMERNIQLYEKRKHIAGVIKDAVAEIEAAIATDERATTDG